MSRKNHKMVDGRLIQMDKRYSNLKQGQKEKINIWINEEIRSFYKEQGILPRKPEQFQFVLDRLYQRIDAAGIWIPYGEMHKRFFGSRNGRIDKVYGQIQKEERSRAKEQIEIEPLPYSFAVCKVEDYSQVDPSAVFCFPQKTDAENSLMCLSEQIPDNTTELQDGWRAFRIKGQMDFSLIGILSGIATVLAGKAISIFVISTFNTDYILVQKEDFEKAIEVLQKAGYSIQENIQEAVDQTLNYYDKNAISFSDSTLHVNFTETQQAFLDCLPSHAHILDFGCGAGRDTKYFLEQGCQVTAVDGSEALCKIASEYTGISVKQMLFQDLDETEKYDGIWACASILHLKKTELSNVLVRMAKALKQQGLIYTSFKYGDFEGMRNGRYFTDFTEALFTNFIKDISGIAIEKNWITGDVRVGRGDERWLNILLRKVDTL